MPESLLKINEAAVGRSVVIELMGDVDAGTAPDLKKALDAQLSKGVKSIVMDFSGLNYISSAGIGVLNAALHSLKTSGGKMAIANPGKAVKDTLDVMYFSKKVPIYSTVDSALKEM
jgi:anti-anti-sigma factor